MLLHLRLLGWLLSKTMALREACMEIIEMLNRGMAVLTTRLRDLLRLIVRNGSVVKLFVLRSELKFMLRKPLRVGMWVALDLPQMTYAISAQIDLGLVPIQIRVYIIKGRIEHILTRLRILLIQGERTMAGMEWSLAGCSRMKATGQIGVALVRRLEEVGGRGILCIQVRVRGLLGARL